MNVEEKTNKQKCQTSSFITLIAVLYIPLSYKKTVVDVRVKSIDHASDVFKSAQVLDVCQSSDIN